MEVMKDTGNSLPIAKQILAGRISGILSSAVKMQVLHPKKSLLEPGTADRKAAVSMTDNTAKGPISVDC